MAPALDVVHRSAFDPHSLLPVMSAFSTLTAISNTSRQMPAKDSEMYLMIGIYLAQILEEKIERGN